MFTDETNNKRIAKNTLLLYLRQLFATCVGLFTSRVFLQVLGVDNVGIYNIVGGVVSMFSLLNGSLTNSCSRYIAFVIGKGDTDELKKTFSTAIAIHIWLSLIVWIIAEIAGVWFLNTHLNIPDDRMTAANVVFQLSLLSFVTKLLNTPYQSLIVSYEKMSAFAYMSIFDVTAKLLILYLLYYINFDHLITYASLLFGVSLVHIGIYHIYSTRKFEVARNLKIQLHQDLFKDMFSFAGWNLFGQGSMILRNQGIDVILNIFYGVTVNAAKSIANQMQGTIYSFVSNFQMAINPQVTKSYAAGDVARTTALMSQGARFSFYLLLFLSMPFMIQINDILKVWLTVIPDWTALFVQLSFIYLLCDTLSRFLIIAIMASGKIKTYQIIVGGTKLFAVPLTYIYIRYWGGTPIAGLLVNIGLEFVCIFQRLYFAKRILDFNSREYFVNVVLNSWVVFGLAYIVPLLSLQWSFSDIWSGIIVRTLICFLSAIIVIGFLGMTCNERQFMLSYFTKKIKNPKSR